MKPLTAKQSAVLEFLRAYIADHGRPPTYAEIAGHFEWSRITPRAHVQALHRSGYIVLEPGKARGIRIVGESWPELEKMAQALRVIRTWAQFDATNNERKALAPKDVLALCDGALS